MLSFIKTNHLVRLIGYRIKQSSPQATYGNYSLRGERGKPGRSPLDRAYVIIQQ